MEGGGQGHALPGRLLADGRCSSGVVLRVRTGHGRGGGWLKPVGDSPILNHAPGRVPAPLRTGIMADLEPLGQVALPGSATAGISNPARAV